MTTDAPVAHWEQNRPCHGYWDVIPDVENGAVQVGWVYPSSRRSTGDRPYAWEYCFAGGLVSGVSPTLDAAKRRVEKLHTQYRAATLRYHKRQRGAKARK